MNEADFPVNIDLGRKETDMGGPLSPETVKGKKSKPRIFYPTLYIDGVEGMPSLPKEGCMMIKFRRKRMSVEENMDGKETGGVTLEIQSLCLPEDMGGDDGDDMASAMKRFAKDKGVADATEEVENDEESEDDED